MHSRDTSLALQTALLAAAASGADGLTAAAYLAKPSDLKYSAKVLRRLARSTAPTIKVPSLLRAIAKGAGGDGGAVAETPPQPTHIASASRALEMWAELEAFAKAALGRQRAAPPGAAALLYSYGMVGG